ncbi:MAG: fumarylacetoacetate hydrolase family protein [Alphaproteobacteria bacterium]|uniref:fumarylacetoacetate hydrolase family protein n=1 Tax=Maricaulis alexandrii TaxID=2570354 RepID=UPI001109AF8D|nr:fumarylacetoacetate hydrolase family protein [Maricaulis alexandrii]MCR9267172.1 fumarylacetoacetate hydrolase family protein [Alphaproteobacteria bacterium]
MSDIITLPAPPRLAIDGQDDTFPVARVFCIGRNYADHAKEMGAAAEPLFFCKHADAVTPLNRLPFPPETEDLHHEVEMVLALGEGGAIVASGVGVDLTRRDLQAKLKAKSAPWEIAKAFHQSAPTGPLRLGPPPTAGAITLSVNGEPRQSGDLSQMILDPQAMLAELSRYFVLGPGDLVFTGTPAGVGPLHPGDRVEARVEGLPTLSFEFQAETAS